MVNGFCTRSILVVSLFPGLVSLRDDAVEDAISTVEEETAEYLGAALFSEYERLNASTGRSVDHADVLDEARKSNLSANASIGRSVVQADALDEARKSNLSANVSVGGDHFADSHSIQHVMHIDRTWLSRHMQGIWKPADKAHLCAGEGLRERVGCKTGCNCAWSETCYPKFMDKQDVGKKVERIDIGMCGYSLRFMVAISIGIIFMSLLCIVFLRVFFQWRNKAYQLEAKTMANLRRSLQYKDGDPRERGSGRILVPAPLSR